VGRFRVVMDNGEVLRLYRQTIEDFGIFSGRDLTEDEMEKLLKSAGEMSAKMRAVRIVSASNVSKRDLEQRLIHKGEDPEQAKEAVRWMSDLNLVDDEKTAEQIVQQCVRKGYGVSRARQALYEKRIPKAYWDKALQSYPNQEEHILSFLQARLGKNPDERGIKRTIDALLRRGHSYSQIRRVLESLEMELDEFQEE